MSVLKQVVCTHVTYTFVNSIIIVRTSSVFIKKKRILIGTIIINYVIIWRFTQGGGAK